MSDDWNNLVNKTRKPRQTEAVSEKTKAEFDAIANAAHKAQQAKKDTAAAKNFKRTGVFRSD